MKKLDLYYIDDQYVNFLRNLDSRVFFNKNNKRPYIGVVYEYNNFKYFAPLASPKPKHLKIKDSALDVYKIKNGNLGIINLNNMIPTPDFCLHLVIPTVKDHKYKKLLCDQLDFLIKYRKKLYDKVEMFQDLYQRNYLPKNIRLRTCDFKLLEEKCLEYEQENLVVNN